MLTWLTSCLFQWSITPHTTSLHSTLSCMPAPSSLSGCIWSPPSTFLSQDHSSRYSWVTLLLFGVAMSTLNHMMTVGWVWFSLFQLSMREIISVDSGKHVSDWYRWACWGVWCVQSHLISFDSSFYHPCRYCCLLHTFLELLQSLLSFLFDRHLENRIRCKTKCECNVVCLCCSIYWKSWSL